MPSFLKTPGSIYRLGGEDGPLIKVGEDGRAYQLEETPWHEATGISPEVTDGWTFPAPRAERRALYFARYYAADRTPRAYKAEVERFVTRYALEPQREAEERITFRPERERPSIDPIFAETEELWEDVTRHLRRLYRLFRIPRSPQAIVDAATALCCIERYGTLQESALPVALQPHIRFLQRQYGASGTRGLGRAIYADTWRPWRPVRRSEETPAGEVHGSTPAAATGAGAAPTAAAGAAGKHSRTTGGNGSASPRTRGGRQGNGAGPERREVLAKDRPHEEVRRTAAGGCGGRPRTPAGLAGPERSGAPAGAAPAGRLYQHGGDARGNEPTGERQAPQCGPTLPSGPARRLGAANPEEIQAAAAAGREAARAFVERHQLQQQPPVVDLTSGNEDPPLVDLTEGEGTSSFAPDLAEARPEVRPDADSDDEPWVLVQYWRSRRGGRPRDDKAEE